MTVQRPVLPGGHPDPSICRVGDQAGPARGISALTPMERSLSNPRA